MRNDGSNATGGDFTVALSVEMDAFDALGPRGRAALNDARFEFSAEAIRQALAGCGVSSLSYPRADGVVENIVCEEDAALLTAASAKTGLPTRTLDASVQPVRRGRPVVEQSSRSDWRMIPKSGDRFPETTMLDQKAGIRLPVDPKK